MKIDYVYRLYFVMFTVAFCGLPSAGKSTIINSLIGERRLQSGVCRTTFEPKTITGLCSDDGVNFTCIDTPGICDGEDKSRTYDDIMRKTIIGADLIFWVSDVSSAFMTTHEKTEFLDMQEYLRKQSVETGKGYQIGIILSKCEIDINPLTHNFVAPAPVKALSATEICDDEDTDIIDCIHRVVKLNLADIILFNAHGRCLHGKSSKELIRYAEKKSKHSTNINIQFNIKKYHSRVEEVDESALINSIIENGINKTILTHCINDGIESDVDNLLSEEDKKSCVFYKHRMTGGRPFSKHHMWSRDPQYSNITTNSHSDIKTGSIYFKAPCNHARNKDSSKCACNTYDIIHYSATCLCKDLKCNHNLLPDQCTTNSCSTMGNGIFYKCPAKHTAYNTILTNGKCACGYLLFPRMPDEYCDCKDDTDLLCAKSISKQIPQIRAISDGIVKLKNKKFILDVLGSFDQATLDKICTASKMSKITYSRVLFDLLAYTSKLYKVWGISITKGEYTKDVLSRLFMIYGPNDPILLKSYTVQPIELYTFDDTFKQVYFRYSEQTNIQRPATCFFDSLIGRTPLIKRNLQFQRDVLELRSHIYGEEPDLDTRLLFMSAELFKPLMPYKK